MAFDLTKAPAQLQELAAEPAKSEKLYEKMNSAIRLALGALDAGGSFALDALVPDSLGGAAANTLLSQSSQEIHSRLLAKSITNAIIEYLREEVTTELTKTELEPTVHGAPQQHVIKPIKLVVP